MAKIIEYNKNNDLIYLTFSKLPTSTQRKIWDVILFTAKKYLQELEENEPEDYAFYSKRGFRNFILPVRIELDYLQTILDIKTQNRKKQLIKNIIALEEISIDKVNVLKEGKSLEVNFDEKTINEILEKYGEDINKWERNRIIINPIVDFENNRFRCYLSPNIISYIDKNNNYTRINVLVHTFLNSTYTINLYNILISRFKAQKEMMEKGRKEKSDKIQTAYINLSDLQDLLGMKKDHFWRQLFKRFNQKVLQPAIKEINESEVTEFKITEVLRKTKGRKVTDLAFVLEEKEDFNIPVLNDEKKIILEMKKDMEELKKIENENRSETPKTEKTEQTDKKEKYGFDDETKIYIKETLGNIKGFCVKNNISDQKFNEIIPLYLEAFNELIKKGYESKFVKNVISYVTIHSFYKNYLFEPKRIVNNFEKIIVAYNDYVKKNSSDDSSIFLGGGERYKL